MCLDFLCRRRGFEDDRRSSGRSSAGTKESQAKVPTLEARQPTGNQEKRETQVISTPNGTANQISSDKDPNEVPTSAEKKTVETVKQKPGSTATKVSSESDGKADQISSHIDANKDDTLISNEVATSDKKKSDENDVQTVKQIPAPSIATKVNGSSEQQEHKILHKTVDQTGESKEQGLDKPTETVDKDDEKVEKKAKKGYLSKRASKFGNGE